MKNKFNLKIFMALLFVALIFTAAFKLHRKMAAIPAPNFSAMEQWYEIVKWTYDDSNGKLSLIIKPKDDPPHTHRQFTVRYFDADGVDLLDYNATQLVGLGYNTPSGQLERVEAGAPYESQAGKIRKVVVYRIRDDGQLIEPPAN